MGYIILLLRFFLNFLTKVLNYVLHFVDISSIGKMSDARTWNIVTVALGPLEMKLCHWWIMGTFVTLSIHYTVWDKRADMEDRLRDSWLTLEACVVFSTGLSILAMAAISGLLVKFVVRSQLCFHSS